MVNIEGLDKAEVLAALHGASKPQGMGFLHDRGPLSVGAAERAISRLRESAAVS